MKIRRHILAVALSASFAVGAAAPVAASVYAGSELSISNLVIIFTDDTGTPITNINPEFTFNVEDSATLNGATDAHADGCSSLGGGCGTAPAPVLTVDAANAPGGTVIRADNDYTLFGPGSGTYSTANAEISTAQLVNLLPTSTQQVAESEVVGADEAQASTNIQSNTSFTLTFTVTGTSPATLDISFSANPEMQALVNLLPPNTEGLAQSNIATDFSLRKLTGDNTGLLVNWGPDGSGTPLCAGSVVCSNILESETLNLTIGAGPDNSNETNSLGTAATPFSLSVAGLTAGDYTLTLAALTSVNVVQIPEPATLLLLGGGLAGLGLVGLRRRQRKDSAPA